MFTERIVNYLLFNTNKNTYCDCWHVQLVRHTEKNEIKEKWGWEKEHREKKEREERKEKEMIKSAKKSKGKIYKKLKRGTKKFE